MRAVSRGNRPAPSSLNQRDKKNQTEIERARLHFGMALPLGAERKPFLFSSYKADEVKLRLEELFHGKCAYCESFYGAQAPVDVEHFRPKGSVEGSPNHPGYWWLAAEWTNLLPSCIDCNRRRKQLGPTPSGKLEVLYKKMQTGKKDCFPVDGVRVQPEASDFSLEKPLLLDPTRDNPDDHLAFWLGDDHAAGLIYPAPMDDDEPGALNLAPDGNLEDIAQHAVHQGISARGAVSIQVYGLNRIRLVQERARVLQQLRFLESILLDVGVVKQDLMLVNAGLNLQQISNAVKQLGNLQSRIIDQMRSFAAPDAIYSSVAKAFLRKFRERLT